MGALAFLIAERVVDYPAGLYFWSTFWPFRRLLLDATPANLI